MKARTFNLLGLAVTLALLLAWAPIERSVAHPRNGLQVWDSIYLTPADGPLFAQITSDGHERQERVDLTQEDGLILEVPLGRTYPWVDDPVAMPHVLMDYTYTLLDVDDDPVAGTPGTTRFVLPVADQDPEQVGLDSYDVDGDGAGDITNVVDTNIPLQPGWQATGDLLITTHSLPLKEGEEITFLDHKAEVADVNVEGFLPRKIHVVVSYTGYRHGADYLVGSCVLHEGDLLSAGRVDLHVDTGANLESPTDWDRLEPVREPWLLQLDDVISDTAYVTVGRLLHTGESFFVGGAEYTVGEIHTEDSEENPSHDRGDAFESITLQNPVLQCNENMRDWPACEGLHVHELTVFKSCVMPEEPIPVLPPFEGISLERKTWGIPVEFRFESELSTASSPGPEIRYLQIVLNADPDTQVAQDGEGAPGNETTSFGASTEQAVIAFQEKYREEILDPMGLESGNGVVGSLTRAKLNEILENLFLEEAARGFPFLNKEERLSAIQRSVEKNQAVLLPESLPKELVLAVAAQETGEEAHWNNEHVAADWGRGVMQITDNASVGAGSGDDSDNCTRCGQQERMVYCSRCYANTGRGVTANTMDGMYALGNSYDQTLDNYDQCSAEADDYDVCIAECDDDICQEQCKQALEWGRPVIFDITCQEMRHISAVQRYHSYVEYAEEDDQGYLLGLRDKLLGLAEWFNLSEAEVSQAADLAGSIEDVWYESIKILSPVHLQIRDVRGRTTGLFEGELKEDIPWSIYDHTNESSTIFFPAGDLVYDVVGTEAGTYGLAAVSVEATDQTTFTANEIPTSDGAVHQYAIDWQALAQGDKGVTVRVDADGDGEFERELTTDEELTQHEFVAPVGGASIPLQAPWLDARWLAVAALSALVTAGLGATLKKQANRTTGP